MSDVRLSTVRGGDKLKRLIITTSKPAIPAPSWAKVVRVIAACAPGGGGGNNTNAGNRGTGGSAGGYCRGLVIPLNGVTSISAVIGAPGVGASGGTNGSGTPGGNCTLTVGAIVVTLEGGQPGGSTTSAIGGRAAIGSITASVTYLSQAPYSGGVEALNGLGGPASPLVQGANGGNAASGNGPGGHSPFGAPGPAVTSVGTNEPGGNATGYGAGGAGSNGTAKAGDGAPGIFIIEFLDAEAA